jgi:GGDEF domain-containing protein
MPPAIPSCASLLSACGKPSEATIQWAATGEEFLLFLTNQGRLTVTCSIGVSSRAHPREVDAELLLREADLAVHGAKGNGRNRVVVPVLL